MKTKILGLALLLCSLSTAFAQFPLRYIDSLYVLGPEPCPNDSVTIIADLVCNTGGLWDIGSTTSIMGNNIQRNATYCQGFLQAFTYRKDTTRMGILPAGTYTFTCNYATADASFNCLSPFVYDTKILTFTVGPPTPVVTFPGNPSNQIGQIISICVGDSFQLVSNSVPNLNIQWLNNGIAIPGATDTLLTINAPGNYAIEMERCGYRDTSGIITVVHSIPNVNLQLSGHACDDDPSFNLNGGTPFGGTWSGPYVSGANFDSFTAPPGWHLITYTWIDSAGCPGTAVDSLFVSPSPFVTLSQQLPVCELDAPFALSGGLPSGGVYSGPGVSNGQFDPSAAGTGFHILNYTYTSADSCSNTASQPIAVNPAAAQPTITQVGDTLFSSAATGNQWYNTNGPIPGATGPWYIPPVSGSYFVVATSSQGCSSPQSSPVSVVITDLEAGLHQAWDLRLAGASLRVQGTPDTPAELTLHDLQGRLLTSAQLRTDARGQAHTNIGQLATGLYLVRLRTADGAFAQKIRVQW